MLNKKIETLLEEYDYIVLKGIKIEGVFSEIVKLIDKKYVLEYFYENIYNMKRRIIYYEEYIVLKDFFKLSNNNRIIVLNNNLYVNYYPLFSMLDEKTIKILRDSNNEESEIVYCEEEILDKDIQIYKSIFLSIEKIKDEYYCVYNEDIDAYNEEGELNETYVDLYELTGEYIVKSFNKDYKIVEISDENEYINFLREIELNKENIYIDISWNIEVLEEKIKIVNKIYNLEIEIFENKEEKFPKIQEIYDILKNYWGYESFRKISLYNSEKIEEKIIEVHEISQEDIINTIIKESEKAYENYGRDVFVTAPTGAGKSIMFQIPAIYLTEKYDGVVIVISPLISLMKDQVKNLEKKGYKYVRTLNSEISLTEKNEIIEEIRTGLCKILYISPETLIGNSILDSILFNDKKIALLVIDEAHIVTTWGKQFRPDYWYLGDYITKIRKKYRIAGKNSFIIATFTATTTYGGEENMFEETKSSLNMYNPHKYFGFIKRDDIKFEITKMKKKTNKKEYRTDKFELLIKHIKKCFMYKKKCLIYFPTVALIEDFKGYLALENYDEKVVTYYATMNKNEKNKSEESFKTGETLIMLATKAFGMGIDINDIEIIIHFAPTGNVCDYLQEVGRAARKNGLIGRAVYDFMSNDFKYINRFHGISTLKKYQLIEVIKKIYSIYKKEREEIKSRFYVKKRNELLLDAEIFSYIFNNPMADDNDETLNKVKTALLIIQKDFENIKKYSPFKIRPIPLFSKGYFKVDALLKNKLIEDYSKDIFQLEKNDIYKINLKKIWEKKYSNKYSFPQFKYFIYSKDSQKINDENLLKLNSCLKIEVSYNKNYDIILSNIMKIFESFIIDYLLKGKYVDKYTLKKKFMDNKIKKYQAEVIADTLLKNSLLYEKKFHKAINGNLVKIRENNDGNIEYSFFYSIDRYIKWLKQGINDINGRLENGTMYIDNPQKQEEIIQLLGIYETMDILTFKSSGGLSGEIYIYINETKTMKQVIMKPYLYKNKILEKVEKRHILNVSMLNYIYSNDFTSDDVWRNIENYFIGIVPKAVVDEYNNKLLKL